MTFNKMQLSEGTLDAVAAMGYYEPTPIQADSIPILLEGFDTIGKAQTGTGKTAAFGIPMIEALRNDHTKGVVGLVLVPTRELAIQVHEVLKDIARGSNLHVTKAFGGTGFGQQTHDLRLPKPVILVACPGRLLDLMQRGVADLSHVKFAVLDEADRMLDMGFVHDVRRICKALPRDRLTALFSATIDNRIKQLSKEFLVEPKYVEVAMDTTATELTTQFKMNVEKPDKPNTLLHLLDAEQPERAVVFARTKHLAKRLAQKLNKHGWASAALQGNMTQGQRERAMLAFREGKARILVATDVAARGLDVPEISHVVNFDLPQEPEAYVHRVGRTGRNGQTGRAFTFVERDQGRDMQGIERLAGTTPEVWKLDMNGQPERGPDEELVLSPPQPQRRPRPAAKQGHAKRGRNPPTGAKSNQGGQRQYKPRQN